MFARLSPEPTAPAIASSLFRAPPCHSVPTLSFVYYYDHPKTPPPQMVKSTKLTEGEKKKLKQVQHRQQTLEDPPQSEPPQTHDYTPPTTTITTIAIF